MGNLLDGGIPELETVKTAVAEAAALKEETEKTSLAFKSKEKDLAAHKKYVADKVSDTVKERKNELLKTHDGRIADANKDVREAERKRQNAKQEAVAGRIREETAELTKENNLLKTSIGGILKKEKMLPICKFSYYLSMFQAKNAKDYLIFAATVVVCLGLIPNIVCLLMHTDLVYKIIVYIGIVALFCGIYAAIYFLTGTSGKTGVFSAIREKKAAISANKKKMKKIVKSIREDKDETAYGLEEFDAEIERCKEIVTGLEGKKSAALEEFEQVTAVEIETKINEENKEALETMESELEKLREEDQQNQENLKQKQESITDEYGTYLGRKNLTEEKIDEMIGFLKEGKAENVMQALDLLKGEIKQ